MVNDKDYDLNVQDRLITLSETSFFFWLDFYLNFL